MISKLFAAARSVSLDPCRQLPQTNKRFTRCIRHHSHYYLLLLLQEDLKSRPKISRILHSLANYNAGLTPSSTDMEKSANAPQVNDAVTIATEFIHSRDMIAS